MCSACCAASLFARPQRALLRGDRETARGPCLQYADLSRAKRSILIALDPRSSRSTRANTCAAHSRPSAINSSAPETRKSHRHFGELGSSHPGRMSTVRGARSCPASLHRHERDLDQPARRLLGFAHRTHTVDEASDPLAVAVVVDERGAGWCQWACLRRAAQVHGNCQMLGAPPHRRRRIQTPVLGAASVGARGIPRCPFTTAPRSRRWEYRSKWTPHDFSLYPRRSDKGHPIRGSAPDRAQPRFDAVARGGCARRRSGQRLWPSCH